MHYDTTTPFEQISFYDESTGSLVYFEEGLYMEEE